MAEPGYSESVRDVCRRIGPHRFRVAAIICAAACMLGAFGAWSEGPGVRYDGIKTFPGWWIASIGLLTLLSLTTMGDRHATRSRWGFFAILTGCIVAVWYVVVVMNDLLSGIGALFAALGQAPTEARLGWGLYILIPASILGNVAAWGFRVAGQDLLPGDEEE